MHKTVGTKENGYYEGGKVMYKLRKVTFKNHPILKNLELDFCGKNGKAVDTVIFAGENGTGKSILIDALYKISSSKFDFECILEVENNDVVHIINCYYDKPGGGHLWVKDNFGLHTIVGNPKYKEKYNFKGIYSDIGINYQADQISHVTSLTLDSLTESRRSTDKLSTQINQLLVDIQDIDDAELARAYRKAKQLNESVDKLEYDVRMARFTKAFNNMFEGLSYNRIINENGGKEIYFQKNGVDIPITKLSSGEKQIVYRGCFLLKDVDATRGAFVFIDEPEISLHPSWQLKILKYYQDIFSCDGKQTSQIFAVTHSPFVIHNESRVNDKVIILSRDDNGNIVINDKSEYYKCNSLEAVKDAFQINMVAKDESVVYLEGRTDEMYFNKALEIYGYDVNFKFKWIGYLNDKGQEENTGKDALNKAVQFLISRNSQIKNVCLYDCDTNKPFKMINNVITYSIPKYKNDANISVGIENALVLDGIDVDKYRKQRKEIDGYGIEKVIPDFQKMEMCEDVCKLNHQKLEVVFGNLKTVIDYLISLLN